MYSQLDAASLAISEPKGVTPGSDTAAVAAGMVSGVDGAHRLVQVRFGGADPVWVPANPDLYTVGALCRVLRSPLDGGRPSIVECSLEDAPVVVTGTVTALNTADGTLDVDVLGDSYVLPAVSGVYSVGTHVLVQRAPALFGRPVVVLGPQGNFASVDPGAPGGGAGNPGQGVSRQVTILPQSAGSWRASVGGWDRWNLDRHGGRSTLWQGNEFGSGPMTGLVTYGDQIVNLNAIGIDRMWATVWRADQSPPARPAVLQPSPHGSRPGGAPAVAGETATSAPLAAGQMQQVDLPGSVFEGFRTGGYRGIATVGGTYAGFSGPPAGVDPQRADGFALTIQYRVIQ